MCSILSREIIPRISIFMLCVYLTCAFLSFAFPSTVSRRSTLWTKCMYVQGNKLSSYGEYDNDGLKQAKSLIVERVKEYRMRRIYRAKIVHLLCLKDHVGVSNQRLTASRLFRGFTAVPPPAVSALFAPFNATYVTHQRRWDELPS